MAKLSAEVRDKLILYKKQLLRALTPFANCNPEIIAGINTDRTLYITDLTTTSSIELTPKHFIKAAEKIRKERYKSIDFLLQKNICSLHVVLQPFALFSFNKFYATLTNINTNIYILSYEGKPVNSFVKIYDFLTAARTYEQGVLQNLLTN